MSSREISDAKNGITSRKSYGFRDPVVRNVVDKFVTPNDAGYCGAGVNSDSDADVQAIALSVIRHALPHFQGEIGQLMGVLTILIGNTRGDHVGVSNRFYFFQTMMVCEFVEGAENII